MKLPPWPKPLWPNDPPVDRFICQLDDWLWEALPHEGVLQLVYSAWENLLFYPWAWLVNRLRGDLDWW